MWVKTEMLNFVAQKNIIGASFQSLRMCWLIHASSHWQNQHMCSWISSLCLGLTFWLWQSSSFVKPERMEAHFGCFKDCSQCVHVRLFLFRIDLATPCNNCHVLLPVVYFNEMKPFWFAVLCVCCVLNHDVWILQSVPADVNLSVSCQPCDVGYSATSTFDHITVKKIILYNFECWEHSSLQPPFYLQNDRNIFKYPVKLSVLDFRVFRYWRPVCIIHSLKVFTVTFVELKIT